MTNAFPGHKKLCPSYLLHKGSAFAGADLSANFLAEAAPTGQIQKKKPRRMAGLLHGCQAS